MTIRHLEIFRCVCSCGQITAAAIRLNMTQPAVSVAIRELEAFYGTKLFDRLNRRIYITEAGKQLLVYAENILAQYEEAALVLRRGQTAFHCRLGVNVSFAESHLSRIPPAVKVQLPGCEMHITVQNNETLRRMLAENELDFAVYDGISTQTKAHETVLFEEQMVVLCADSVYPGDSITLKALSALPLLSRERGSGVRTCMEAAFAAQGHTPRVVMESSSTLSLLSLAKAGHGCVFMPISLAYSEIAGEALHIVGLRDAEITRIYHLAYNERKHLTQSMKAVRDTIVGIWRSSASDT